MSKNFIQKYCEFQANCLAKKEIKPTDKIVCYQFSQNPNENVYVLNKKYEELFKKLGKLYQKGNDMQKFIIEKKVKKIFATTGLIFFIILFTADKKETNLNISKEALAMFESNTIIEKALEVKNSMTFKSIREEEAERRALYDSYIEEYCGYYNLDSKKVIELARNLTNGYEISFQNFIKREFNDFSNPAAACMRFVYYLNRKELINDENVEYNLEELELPENIITTPHNDFETLVLNNGEGFTQNLGKICDYFEYDEKTLALSFCYVEAGKYGSYASNNKNNPFGIMSNGSPKSYPTLEACIIDHIGNLKNFYPLDKYNIYDLETLSLKYNKADEATRNRWKENMKFFYNEINDKYEELFFTESQETSNIILSRK